MTVRHIEDTRVVFVRPDQQAFFKDVERSMRISGVTWASLADTLQITSRTLRTWRRSEYLILESQLLMLCSLMNLALPEYETKPLYWSVSKAGKLGYATVVERYGRMLTDKEKQKKGWREWLKAASKDTEVSPLSHPKRVILPHKSVELAEWTGLVIGDGGITPAQITVSLNLRDDSDYARYVSRLTKRLFGLAPSVIERPERTIVALILSRVQIVRFCRDELGMIIGNKTKQGVGIPDWIIKGSSAYQAACIRGLFDTDGTVTTHKYTVRKKQYAYKKLSFSSASPKLIDGYFTLLLRLGIRCRVTKDGKNVVVESMEMVGKYFQIIGSSNPKHLKRYRK